MIVSVSDISGSITPETRAGNAKRLISVIDIRFKKYGFG
jgi:hypothetical protein